jgi:SAM-dependent methyltransferase
MSIAYSFSNDGSGPVRRGAESGSAVLDAPRTADIEPADFEMKTREMSAVDLEQLGLSEPGAGSTLRMARLSDPVIDTHVGSADPRAATTTDDIDVPIDTETTELVSHLLPPIVPPDRTKKPSAPPRLKTVALSDDDLEDMRAPLQAPGTAPPAGTSARPAAPTGAPGAQPPNPIGAPGAQGGAVPSTPGTTSARPAAPPIPTGAPGAQPPNPIGAPGAQGGAVPSAQSPPNASPTLAGSSSPAPTSPPPTPLGTTKPPPLAVARPAAAEPNRTMPIALVDVEIDDKRPVSEDMSVPELDISELADRSADSGDIPIDVDEAKPKAADETKTKAVDETKPKAVEEAKAKARPARPTPSPPTPTVEARHRGPTDPPAPNAHAANANAHAPTTPPGPHAPPPPPPKAPPAPPPASAKKPPPAAVAAVITKEPSKPAARGRPWFVDLFDEDYLRTLPFLTPQATQAEAEFVIQTMNLAAGAQVLDLGCGYGRHAMELAARGFHVVGLDLSTPLLVRGGEEAHRRGLTINFIRGDMRELDFDSQFDGAYCLFSTFGYFDDETNKKTLMNVARALKPGGKVLVEILNRDYVIADLPTRVWWEGDGCVVLEEVELNYFSSRIQVNRSVVFDDGRQLEQEISVRAYSLHEVGKLMHAAGFRVLEVSGGYQTRGRFFGNQSRHIIVLAERKDAAPS